MMNTLVRISKASVTSFRRCSRSFGMPVHDHRNPHLEKKLKSAGVDISSKEAWQLLKTVRVVDLELGDGANKRLVTQGTLRAAKILKIVGVRSLDPDAAGRNKAA